MWNKAYGATMASVLAIVVAVAFMPGPVMAASTDEATQPTTSSPVEKKKTETDTHMQGRTGEMMKGKTPEHMKGQMMREEKTGAPAETKAKMSGEAKTEAAREMKAGEPKASAETKARMSGEAKTEVSGKMKTDVSGRTKAGMTEPTGEHRGRAAPEVAQERVQGGQALVVRVDRPDNCLRIRSGPSASDKVVGCAATGTQLNLTGVFSRDGRWAQLNNNGWVFFSQLKTSVKAPASVSSRSWEEQAGKGFHRRGGAYSPYRYGYYYGSPYYYYGWPHYYGHYCR